ncbi:transcription termination factor 2 [Battus philenor]|uniref:transcription termination factor 2 n=1 Tax=Battus philenor TaxID=42288 RepID=UPI0035CFABD5
MESSFFEYRDTTGAGDESDIEIIDDSLTEDCSNGSLVKLSTPLLSKRKPHVKNQTVFIAESEESTSEDDTNDDEKKTNTSSFIGKSRAATSACSDNSDDENNTKETRRQSHIVKKVVSSSSDEEMSPEIVPRRRPNVFKNRKRMILMDSDTENSIVNEHNQNRKNPCLKETPAKITVHTSEKSTVSRESVSSNLNSSEEQIEDSSDNESDNDCQDENDKYDNGKEVTSCSKPHKGRISSSDEGNDAATSEDDKGVDEDQMVMSRATRMSIMGFVPKDTASDDSDFIQSDDNSSRPDSAGSGLVDLPDVSVSLKTPKKSLDNVHNNSSALTCSPFMSPLKDVTNELNVSSKSNDSSHKAAQNERDEKVNNSVVVYDLTGNRRNSTETRVVQGLTGNEQGYRKTVIDDDVTIIDSKPEVIALSSDDDYEIKEDKKSPRISGKKSSQKVSGDMKQYLLPPSHPARVVYVKQHVRDTELRKLEGLREDLLSIRHLLDNMDEDMLPDGGAKLVERLSALEEEVRRQGDKVAAMIVEPDEPIVVNGVKIEEDKGLTWDDIKKASDNVQPRMFGKQAMATHMAERNLILERLRDLHEALASRPPETAQAEPPAALTTKLMPHQLHALAWLRWRETQRPPGGILADDMGLGKTLTMIALIAADKDGDTDDDEETGRSGTSLVRGGTLVVCPASLMQQWAEEVQKHCRPHRISVCLHHGASRALQPHRLASHDLVLTTYNILLREAEKKGALCRVRWRRVILDEAHAVRNHKSATAGAVLPARLAARRRWALTGTPLHNRDLDLFALLRFLGCSPFDDLPMWKKWIDNKSLGGQERLSTIMRCIMLRRTKQQLQERGQLTCLPERELHEREVALSRDEMNVYQKLLVFSKTLFGQFLQQRAEKRADVEDTAYAEMHKRMVKLQGAKPVKSHEILVLLLRLRQVCCHCGLIAAMLTDDDVPADELNADSPENDLLDELNKLVLEDKQSKRKSGARDDAEEEDKAEEGSTAAEAVRSVLARNNPVFSLDRLSSKIAAVMTCLKENVFPNAGEKAVVVSQWTGVLRLVERELQRARVRCVTLCGDVPVPARAPLVAALNDPASPVRVMLLSLTAGGVGLNLCGANHLLLLDPHWNPQLEQQAQDRVYRVGQHRRVHIYRFMCVDTVEQSIRKLQQVKLELADNVLTGARHTNASKLSIEDLKMLFNMAPQ